MFIFLFFLFLLFFIFLTCFSSSFLLFHFFSTLRCTALCRTAQNLALFSLSRHNVHSFLPSIGCLFVWNFAGVFEGAKTGSRETRSCPLLFSLGRQHAEHQGESWPSTICCKLSDTIRRQPLILNSQLYGEGRFGQFPLCTILWVVRFSSVGWSGRVLGDRVVCNRAHVFAQ